MKILKVIHGYPPRYSAGSEVYSQLLCHQLQESGHEVCVFTRQQDAYQTEYSLQVERDPHSPEIQVHVINMANGRDGYSHPQVDRAFENLLRTFEPDVVHFGHLNHLSTGLVKVAKRLGHPVIFTLHDFWLMCPRGQFLQSVDNRQGDLYPVCASQESRKCASQCYWRYFGDQNSRADKEYWTQWVDRRMDHVKKDVIPFVDLFIAPSRYLMNRFTESDFVNWESIVYLDYGFKRQHLESIKKKEKGPFTIGYIGTHSPAKGIIDLIEAFSNMEYQDCLLKIWGHPIAPFTQSLKQKVSALPLSVQERISWMGGYENHRIGHEVLNHLDAIVVPSIWGENSPLVIHEAQEAKLPVITANFGGMKEYVHHEVNGLLFDHRSPQSLRVQMDRLASDSELHKRLSEKGYLFSTDGRIPSIEKHTDEVVNIYQAAIQRRKLHAYKERSLAYHV